MSARAKTFMKSWSRDSAPLGHAMTGANPSAEAMLAELLAEASFFGISRRDIEDEVGNVTSFIAAQIGHGRMFEPLLPDEASGAPSPRKTKRSIEGG
ncbi:hypothetical protein C3941_00010 [Kaistia algarum]|uniref:DUF768 domain-containing protein n=1 Tax=Kaistia algarum TaxID=2083279 RepID=UPI000CE8503E|nr:DUF768 domain-containing protein [Kaistia algarum]MCX5513399.1 DUF768 domain-containing protein [Kaistia algarum]PPE81156.1 hypothetical protein C3941_00010 [Kaistia algarum]